MIIVLRPGTSDSGVDRVLEHINHLGLTTHLSRRRRCPIIGVIGEEQKLKAELLSAMPRVQQILPILKPYKLASRELQSDDPVVQIGDVRIGGVRLL